MMTSLKQKLLTSIPKCLFNFLTVLLFGSNIGFRMTGYTKKITELAIGNTNIRSVYITVDNPGNFIAGLMVLPDFITNIHEFTGWYFLKQILSFRGCEELQRKGFFQQLVCIHFQ